jgi:predicted transcriptional regulator
MSDVRMTVVMPTEVDNQLADLASSKSTSKSEIVRRALALYMVAAEAQIKGQHVALVNDENKVLKQVVGI